MIGGGFNKKYVIGMIIASVAVIITLRLFYIQVLDPSYKVTASNNVLRYITQYPSRGLIYDRNGELLVCNEAAYDLMVIPQQLKAFDTLEFSAILSIPIDQIRATIKLAKADSYYRPYVFAKQVSAFTYARLQERLYKFPGFYVQPRTLRTYPLKIAGNLLGYVGEVNDKMMEKDPYYKMGDYIGVSGLEKAYEEVLRGRKGVTISLVDVHNRIKGSYQNGRFDTLAILGKNIVATIDAELQAYGEKLMANKVGSVVAIEPSTGEILAMVSSPDYDPTDLTGRNRRKNWARLALDPLNPMFNRATQAMYPPGSTFKLVNALIGLQEGIIDEHTAYGCGGGFAYGGRVLKCHPHGSPVNVFSAIQVSCNSFFSREYVNLINSPKYGSPQKAYAVWKNYLNQFGFGRHLNTDLNFEKTGIVKKPEYFDKMHNGRWNGYTIVSMGIGQGELGTTPVQIANMVATIANRGYYVIPHAVKEIEGQQIDKRFRQKNYVSIDTSYFNDVVEGMRLSVTGGTSHVAAIPDIEVCGKTGTAQNPTGTKDDHSVFVAFAPRVNPKIAIAVYVENAGFGATYAAPIASLMMEKYLKDTVTRKPLEDRIISMDLTVKLKAVFAAQKAAKEAKALAKKHKMDSAQNAAKGVKVAPSAAKISAPASKDAKSYLDEKKKKVTTPKKDGSEAK
jgi:penicillin-binding protein 2